jgi:acyl-coenzyme A synthetase/AMP-(fatty) acid ligase
MSRGTTPAAPGSLVEVRGADLPAPHVPDTPEWVDEVLLAGPDRDVCLHLGGPLDRAGLRALVAQRQERLVAAGLRRGDAVALRLPPSLAYVANLLAAWRIGAQVMLLDYRLTPHEVEQILRQLAPTLVVGPQRPLVSTMRGYVDVAEGVTAYPGRRPATSHALVQLSSGSTGPSKVIGRSVADLVTEIDRYTRIDGVPVAGERIALLASMVHVLGLVGGLLYGLHARACITVPERLTADSIFTAVRSGSAPATLLGVPFHIELLATVDLPPTLAALKRMTTGGELVRPDIAEAFDANYGVPLGNMYGMTEIGVVATDLSGVHRPSLQPAPGLAVRAVNGELEVSRATSPYLGTTESGRWADGWLRTRDAGTVDVDAGLMTVKGRRDSQVSVGGLKVDLTEVEHTLTGLPGVAAAVVVHTGQIEAYLQLRDEKAGPGLEAALADRLAPYKRPRILHIVARLPRTTTGKLVREISALRGARQ